MITALDVSEYFLKGLSEPEEGDIISNLKLQKLLYYAQGMHLAKYDEALFEDEIVRWQHGPVVISVYEKYKKYDSLALPLPKEVKNASKFSKAHIDSIAMTYNHFGQYSAWVLSQKTHEEGPWKDTVHNEIITKEVMKTFFKKKLPRLGILALT